MSNLREAAQQALEALEAVHPYTDSLICYASTIEQHPPNAIDGKVGTAITALNAALAEPNADYERGFIDGMSHQAKSSVDRAVNAMVRKPLPNEEIVSIELRLRKYVDGDRYDLSLNDFARAIEQAHGIKQEEA